jgi:hypothetical protein
MTKSQSANAPIPPTITIVSLSELTDKLYPFKNLAISILGSIIPEFAV